MKILVDESGDLGWSFDRPFRQGGSSRYLTVVCLIVPRPHYRRPEKIIASLYKKYAWQSEKKASEASDLQQQLFCEMATDLLTRYPEIKLDVITVNKVNVQAHIRQDSNKLYNYMLGLVIPDYVSQEGNFTLITDERSIKVKSQNSLKDYLEIKLWFEKDCPAQIKHFPTDSSTDYGLQFVDWIAHCVWTQHENGEDTFLRILRPVIKLRSLYF